MVGINGYEELVLLIYCAFMCKITLDWFVCGL